MGMISPIATNAKEECDQCPLDHGNGPARLLLFGHIKSIMTSSMKAGGLDDD